MRTAEGLSVGDRVVCEHPHHQFYRKRGTVTKVEWDTREPRLVVRFDENRSSWWLVSWTVRKLDAIEALADLV